MSKQPRSYICPFCKGTVAYPPTRRLTHAAIEATQTIHEESCPGRARHHVNNPKR